MFPKPTKIKSKKIRDSAKGESCTLRLGDCSGRDTVVFAHLNSVYKGIGNKSPDIFGCYACYNCHQKLDAGEVEFEDQLMAMQETLMKLYQKRLIKI